MRAGSAAIASGNNRGEREAEVKAKYDFYVPGGEYSVFNALLIAADAIITGGNFTAQYLENQASQFGIDLATAMARTWAIIRGQSAVEASECPLAVRPACAIGPPI
jgi:hypothetical protein